ncbi:MAG: hypothetical protein WCK51_13790 [Armatimonadota bacterium]
MKLLKLAVAAALLGVAVVANAQMRIHAKSPVGILSMKVVQKELKLTDEQVAMVKRVDQDYRATINGMMGGGFSGGSIEDLQAQVDAESSKLTKQVDAALTAEQKQRLRELDLQFGPPITILNEAYAAELKLTSEQKTQIKTYHQEFLDQMGDLQQAGVTSPEELTVKRGKLRANAMEAIEKVLSPDQIETLKKLKGAIVKA